MPYPEECRAVGLACEPCVESNARELASACPGLRGKWVGQLFVQIYTESACARMHTHFVRAYAQADLLDVRGIRSKPIATADRHSVLAIAATA
jgi:hypothetical protein